MFRKAIIFCLLIAILSPLALLVLAIDAEPLVSGKQTPDSASAHRTKLFLQRSWDVIKQDRRAMLPVRVEDLNAAIAFAGRGTSFLSGRATLREQVLTGELSVKIPRTPFGEYINLSARILPSDTGLKLASCKIGKLSIPGPLALWGVTTLVDLINSEELGSRLLATVEKVSFTGGFMLVTFRSGAEFGRLKSRLIAQLKDIISRRNSTLEQEKLTSYLRQLETLNNGPFGASAPLQQIMVPFFQQVQQNTVTSSALEETRAALQALVIYLGGWEIYQLNSYLLAPHTPFPRNTRTRFQLAGRDDLGQHFLVSTGIKLLSDAQVGFAVGEFKELLDANPGGSGFSFIDLAADRAGLALAEKATSSEKHARAFLQRIIEVTSDREIFPSFADLAEGLSEKSFIDRYGNIDSSRYQRVVELIDQRLTTLPLYQ